MHKKYHPGDVIDLDDVVPSPAALAAWGAVAQQAVAYCHLLGVPDKDLPEEKGGLNADGSLSILIEIVTPSGGGLVFNMTIPAGEWRWK